MAVEPVAVEPAKQQTPPEDEIRGRSQWADGARCVLATLDVALLLCPL